MPAYSSKRRNQGCTDEQCKEDGCKPGPEKINLTDRYFNLSESDVNCHICGEIVADNERLVQCSNCGNKGHNPCIHACELKCKEKKEKETLSECSHRCSHLVYSESANKRVHCRQACCGDYGHNVFDVRVPHECKEHREVRLRHEEEDRKTTGSNPYAGMFKPNAHPNVLMPIEYSHRASLMTLGAPPTAATFAGFRRYRMATYRLNMSNAAAIVVSTTGTQMKDMSTCVSNASPQVLL